MTTTYAEAPLPAPDAPYEPSRLARWVFAGALFTAYLPMQLLIAVPFVLVYFAMQGPAAITDIQDLTEQPELLWMTLAAAGIAALLTIGLALAWPAIWRVLSRRPVPFREWLAWVRPRYLPLWSVPLLTVPVLILVGLVVFMQFGPTEIDIQMQLFSTPALQAASLLVVSTIVPVAEEFVFRGALYNALLGPDRHSVADGDEARDVGRWRRHAVPFVITTLAFASVHLLAGFETVAAIIQIMLLSLFLTLLRSVTGSVKPSVAAHLLWNLIAGVGLIITNMQV